MAFSASDLTNIDAAMVQLAIDGIASVNIDGQSVTVHSLDQLRRLREMIADNIAASGTHGGIRLRQMVPGECG